MGCDEGQVTPLDIFPLFIVPPDCTGARVVVVVVLGVDVFGVDVFGVDVFGDDVVVVLGVDVLGVDVLGDDVVVVLGVDVLGDDVVVVLDVDVFDNDVVEVDVVVAPVLQIRLLLTCVLMGCDEGQATPLNIFPMSMESSDCDGRKLDAFCSALTVEKKLKLLLSKTQAIVNFLPRVIALSVYL